MDMSQLILYSILFVISLFVVVRGIHLIIQHATPVARFLRLSEFVTVFLVIGVLSVFPEATISIISALKGIPTLGMGTIFGSNVADLTLVFGVATFFTARGMTIKSDFLKKDLVFILPLLLPIVLGIDGRYSRLDGALLILGGFICFFILYQMGHRPTFGPAEINHDVTKHVILFLVGVVALIGAAYATVVLSERIAGILNIPEVLIGLSLITLGTTLPELSFAVNASRTKKSELILGDVLGIVITDATVVLGLMALIAPYSFDRRLIFVTGFAMVLAAVISLGFMKSRTILTKREGVILILLYILFLTVEFSLQGGLVNLTP
jgi:cation:H+ antiporter